MTADQGTSVAPAAVCVLGASGRIGRHALGVLHDRGHPLVVLTRSDLVAPADVVVIRGDATDAGAVTEAIAHVQAVVSALGPRGNRPDEADSIERAMAVVVTAMERAGIRRLVALSGAGVTLPDDRKPLIDRVASRLVGVMARHVLSAKQREHAVLSASVLDWTALRPPIVVDGAPRGYALDDRLSPMARVTRADVGRALADQVTDVTWLRRSPFVLPPR